MKKEIYFCDKCGEMIDANEKIYGVYNEYVEEHLHLQCWIDNTINSERFSTFTNQIKVFEKSTHCNFVEYKVPRQYGVTTYLEAMMLEYKNSFLFTFSTKPINKKFRNSSNRVTYINDSVHGQYKDSERLRGASDRIIFVETFNNNHIHFIEELASNYPRLKFVVFNQVDMPLI